VLDNSATLALFDEVRLLFHRLTLTAEQLHAGEPITVGMRGVLEYLQRNGPATVPTIARQRQVTRQHIQTLVNALLGAGLVAADDNPAHQRSPLIALTAAGNRVITRMRRREQRYLERLDLPMSQPDLNSATQTLRALRDALEALR